MRRCAQAYRALADKEPKRCVVIDGRAPRDVVAERIWNTVEQRLHPASRTRRGGDGCAVSDDDTDERRPAAARNLRAVRPCRGRAGAARNLPERPHSACLADRRAARHRQGDAGLSAGAFRARASRSAGAGGAEGDIARGRCRQSGRAPHRRAGARRSPGAGARHQRADRQALYRDPRRRRAPLGVVLRLDRGRGRLAHRHRRCGRRSAARRRQCAAQGSGRAAGAHAAAADQPRAGPRTCRPSARAAGACCCARSTPPTWRARSRRRPAATPTMRMCRRRPPPPTAASGARSASSTARRWRCASACSTCSRSFPIPIRARCMRSATRSAAASRKRLPPSWTWSTAGCRRGSTDTRQARRMAAHRRGLGQGQPRRARRRDLQSRTQAAGVRGVRLAGRSGEGLTIAVPRGCGQRGSAGAALRLQDRDRGGGAAGLRLHAQWLGSLTAAL